MEGNNLSNYKKVGTVKEPPVGAIIVDPQNTESTKYKKVGTIDALPKGVSESDVFEVRPQEKGYEVPRFEPEYEPDALEIAKASWGRGVGQLKSSIGGALERKGYEYDSETMKEMGQSFNISGKIEQEQNAMELPEDIKEFSWDDILKPSFYLHKGPQLLPMMGAMVAPSVVSGLAGAAIGTAVAPGFGTVAGLIGGAVSSGIAGTAIESGLESGMVWNDVKEKLKEKGVSEEEANVIAAKEAASVSNDNWKFLALNVAENALMFGKVFKTAKIAGRLAKATTEAEKVALQKALSETDVLTKFAKSIPKPVSIPAKYVGMFGAEGSQELLQRWWSDQAVNRALGKPQITFDDFVADPSVQEEFALGGIMGASMMGLGDISSSLFAKKQKNSEQINERTNNLNEVLDALNNAKTTGEQEAIRNKFEDDIKESAVSNNRASTIRSVVDESKTSWDVSDERIDNFLKDLSTHEEWNNGFESIPLTPDAKKKVFSLIKETEAKKNVITELQGNSLLPKSAIESGVKSMQDSIKKIESEMSDIFSGKYELSEQEIMAKQNPFADIKIEQWEPVQEKDIPQKHADIVERVRSGEKVEGGIEVSKNKRTGAPVYDFIDNDGNKHRFFNKPIFHRRITDKDLTSKAEIEVVEPKLGEPNVVPTPEGPKFQFEPGGKYYNNVAQVKIGDKVVGNLQVLTVEEFKQAEKKQKEYDDITRDNAGSEISGGYTGESETLQEVGKSGQRKEEKITDAKIKKAKERFVQNLELDITKDNTESIVLKYLYEKNPKLDLTDLHKKAIGGKSVKRGDLGGFEKYTLKSGGNKVGDIAKEIWESIGQPSEISDSDIENEIIKLVGSPSKNEDIVNVLHERYSKRSGVVEIDGRFYKESTKQEVFETPQGFMTQNELEAYAAYEAMDEDEKGDLGEYDLMYRIEQLSEEDVVALNNLIESELGAWVESKSTEYKVEQQKIEPKVKEVKGVFDVDRKIEDVIADGEYIKRKEDKSGYVNEKTGKEYKSVSGFLNQKQESKGVLESAHGIGSKVAEIVKDFFSGNLKPITKYDVTTSVKQFKELINELELVKQKMDERGEKVYSDVVVYNDKLGVAGTINLLTVDKGGNVRIYDVATRKSSVNYEVGYKGGKSNAVKDTEKLSMYRILLNNTYGIKAKQVATFLIEVDYNKGDKRASLIKKEKGVPLEVVDSIVGADKTVAKLEEKPEIKHQKRSKNKNVVDKELSEFIRTRMATLFPNVKRFTDPSEFQAFLDKLFPGTTLDLKALGAAIGNTYYINENEAIQTTELHEMAHIYYDALPNTDSTKLTLQTLFNNNEENIIEAIATEGVELAKDVKYKFRSLLKKFWKAVKDLFGIKTKQDYAKIMAERLWNNTDRVDFENFKSDSLKFQKKSDGSLEDISEAERIAEQNRRIKWLEDKTGKGLGDLTIEDIDNLTGDVVETEDDLKMNYWNAEFRRTFGYLPTAKQYSKNPLDENNTLRELWYDDINDFAKDVLGERRGDRWMNQNSKNTDIIKSLYDEYKAMWGYAKNTMMKYESRQEIIDAYEKSPRELNDAWRKLNDYKYNDSFKFLLDVIGNVIGKGNTLAAVKEQAVMDDNVYKDKIYSLYDTANNTNFEDVSGLYNQKFIAPQNIEDTRAQTIQTELTNANVRANEKALAYKEKVKFLIKEQEKNSWDLKPIIEVVGDEMLFIEKDSTVYGKLSNAGAYGKFLKDVLDLHYDFIERETSHDGGVESRRVAQVKADIGELRKEFGFVEAVTIKSLGDDKLDEISVHTKDGIKTIGDIKKDVLADKGLNKAKKVFELNKYKAKAQNLFDEAQRGNTVLDASGKIIDVGKKGIPVGVSFKTNKYNTKNILAAQERYYTGTVLKTELEKIAPTLNYIKDSFGKSNNKNLISFIDRLLKRELYGERETSKLPEPIRTIAEYVLSYTYLKFLGFNPVSMVFNISAGISGNIRELGLKNTILGAKRLVKMLKITKDFDQGFVSGKIINMMRSTGFMTTSKDVDLSPQGKTMTRLNNFIFSPITVAETINQGITFASLLTEEEMAMYNSDGSLKAGAKGLSDSKKADILFTLSKIHGSYYKTTKRMINDTVEGRFIMATRGWMPDFFNAHVQKNKVLRGKATRGLIPSTADFTQKVVWEGVFLKKDMVEVKKAYDALPTVDKINMKKMGRAAFMIGTLALVKAMADDDRDKKRAYTIGRMLSDMTTVYSLDSYKYLFDKPVPSFSVMSDLIKASQSVIAGDVYKTDSKYGKKGESKAVTELISAAPFSRIIKDNLLEENQ